MLCENRPKIKEEIVLIFPHVYGNKNLNLDINTPNISKLDIPNLRSTAPDIALSSYYPLI